MKEKVKWEQPKLIILGRGAPEENVLLGCKQHNMDFGKGPGALVPCISFEVPCDAPAPS